ncbi:MAG: metal-dependent transcriptional regulator [SAR202 cluster bacterium]|nr:metal-dependent transcriptional regulator [SAR202 cluster bacterium]MDP6512507.1 metal-dependent transcriptional regulator [SAR202 cluster bacterium]
MSAENYLLSIYRLDEEDTRVTLTALSEHLKTLPVDEGMGTSLPSVGGMIRRMVREGLLESTPQKDVVLTTSGRKSAEEIVRRHRLAERLVVDLLGLDLHLAHIEAHRLEHAISPVLEEKIVDALGNPKTCPFGHPIPGSGYKGDNRVMPLGRASDGDRLIIDSVPEDDQALLEYLVGNHLIPGQTVTVKETAATRGVITLDCDGNEVVFSYDVAAKIRVYPAD